MQVPTPKCAVPHAKSRLEIAFPLEVDKIGHGNARVTLQLLDVKLNRVSSVRECDVLASRASLNQRPLPLIDHDSSQSDDMSSFSTAVALPTTRRVKSLWPL